VIVVDVNTVAYLWIPGELTSAAEKVLAKDPDWVAPQLWRSEFRNILAQYLRRDAITHPMMYRCLNGAESQLDGKTYTIPSVLVMKMVECSACSAYDCEYVALADSLGVKLVTADKQICREFPRIAVNLKDFSV
jgi:predicted nucleic acid-binding protein